MPSIETIQKLAKFLEAHTGADEATATAIMAAVASGERTELPVAEGWQGVVIRSELVATLGKQLGESAKAAAKPSPANSKTKNSAPVAPDQENRALIRASPASYGREALADYLIGIPSVPVASAIAILEKSPRQGLNSPLDIQPEVLRSDWLSSFEMRPGKPSTSSAIDTAISAYRDSLLIG